MTSDLSEKLRDYAHTLMVHHENQRSALVSEAAHRIEHLEQQLQEYKGMLEDAEHFRDHWFDRYLELAKNKKQILPARRASTSRYMHPTPNDAA